VGTSEKERNKNKEFGAEISLAVEKLVKEKLGHLEDAVLLGNKFYRKPTPQEAELYLQDKVVPRINVRIVLEKGDVELGETFDFKIELQNIGKTPVLLTRLEEIAPSGFELVAHPDAYSSMTTSLDMHGKKLNPYEIENLEIALRATKKGTFIIAPKILFVSETGRNMAFRPEPASINVSETILSGRISTGFQDLDNLLLGGIPQNYAVILTSASCDERDLLIRRYLEAGATKNDITFHITIDAANVRNLAEEFQSHFYVFVCNPKLDEAFENLPNVSKLGGVENLTEVNISLESALRKLGEPKGRPRRACLEILSDVLLQHHAVQTRRWLIGLIPELRSKGFTTLAVMNPHMHTPEETHAVLDLFEGEINIYEKETQKDMTKYLRIKKLYNQRYLESELPLRKTRLMTTPLRLPCCTRSPNL
jgi:KaiC/GvpD/RAD55 family RecA-like ATPase